MTSILFQLVGDCCKSIEPVHKDVRFVEIEGVKYVPERTCDGCRFEGTGEFRYPCYDCTHLNYNDLYEPKVVG